MKNRKAKQWSFVVVRDQERREFISKDIIDRMARERGRYWFKLDASVVGLAHLGLDFSILRSAL